MKFILTIIFLGGTFPKVAHYEVADKEACMLLTNQFNHPQVVTYCDDKELFKDLEGVY